MRPIALAYLYGRRLRTHPVQELLAGAGIAIGVALTFAVQVANHSVTGSARATAQQLASSVDLELRARSAQGVDQRVVERVRRLSGVRRASGLLEQRALLAGRAGRRVAVSVIGAELGSHELGGLLRGTLSVTGLELRQGLVLPDSVASSLGLPLSRAPLRRAQPRITLRVRGRAASIAVGTIPGRDRIGTLGDGRVVVMRRAQLQRIAQLERRVTRVLVQARPGQEQRVRRQLAALAAGRLAVDDPAAEITLLERATAPSDRATTFFTMIALLIGWLLAFNAMLLSSPERRRVLAELRIQGFRVGQLVQLALFQAAALGLAASCVGLLVGRLLAQGMLHDPAQYLSQAFSFGTATSTDVSALLISLAGGVISACLAAVPPLLVLRGHDATGVPYRDADEGGQALAAASRRRLALAALALLVVGAGLLALSASAALLTIVALALALLLALPAAFAAALRLFEYACARAGRLTMPVLGLLILRPTTLRSLALAATAALALFGSIAVGGARDDLLRGIARFTAHYTASADLWIAQPADVQATRDFPVGELPRRIAAVPGVDRVDAYRGAFLDVAGHRAWVIAPPTVDETPLPATELVDGDADRLQARLRGRGWITISAGLAEALGAKAGARVRLPMPAGSRSFRVAATTTNFGWSSGAIVLSSADFKRGWESSDPTALQVRVRAGSGLQTTASAVAATLGPGSALEVRTAAQRAAAANASARTGLARLDQIATLVVVGAALALAAAMSAAIWQQRPMLAALRLQGLRVAQLWRVLLTESMFVLIVGCAAGLAAGVYGQFLIDRYLRVATGFPSAFAPAASPVLQSLLLLGTLVMTGMAVPSYLAAQAPARLGLQE